MNSSEVLKLFNASVGHSSRTEIGSGMRCPSPRFGWSMS